MTTLTVLAVAMLSATTPPDGDKFYVYRDANSPHNHGVWTNFMPDPEKYEGADDVLQVSQTHKLDPNTGETCVRIQVKEWVKPFWAGLAVSCEPDYVGLERASSKAFDLRDKKKLVFFARGEQGGEFIQVKVAIYGDKTKIRYGDSAKTPAESKWIKLKKGWAKYELDLRRTDLRRVVSPFCIIVSREFNESGNFTFYLDDIYFE